ncbi:MAG: hypothetical protein HY329_09545 [Chloroflexi bacterium]|nr:hypothetical protein [Chloroflexota bacterium]
MNRLTCVPVKLLVGLVLLHLLSLGAGALSSARAESTGFEDPFRGSGGGGNNLVNVVNQANYQLSVRGSIQLNRIPGPSVEPVNHVMAYSSCAHCQTLGVALQINLISRTATRITPQNAALAINSDCTGCYTVARAMQYVHQVDDPTQVPPEITALLRELDRELTAIGADPRITLVEAETRLNAVIAQFQEFAASFEERRVEMTQPTGVSR